MSDKDKKRKSARRRATKAIVANSYSAGLEKEFTYEETMELIDSLEAGGYVNVCEDDNHAYMQPTEKLIALFESMTGEE